MSVPVGGCGELDARGIGVDDLRVEKSGWS